MRVQVEKIVFHDWVSLKLGSGWTDTFIFRISPRDGLPPADYAALVRPLSSPLRKSRPDASIWVQILGHGTGQQYAMWAGHSGLATGPTIESADWFRNEFQYALRTSQVPVAVTNGSEPPGIWDFSSFPTVDRWPYPPPPVVEPLPKKYVLKPVELKCLRALARADCGFTGEVASLAAVSRNTALLALRGLKAHRLVDMETAANFPLWKIRRPGVSVALRSWGHPPGRSFRYRRERGPDACAERLPERPQEGHQSDSREPVTFYGRRRKVTFSRSKRGSLAFQQRRRATRRHRRTARLWPAWIRKALPQAEIWAGWSEVTCGRSRPDGLCWGKIYGRETLFWLEVESGHDSREKLRRKMIYRINKALVYARRSPVRLVFTLMAPRWVWKEAAGGVSNLPGDLALVFADWTDFGYLPMPAFGRPSAPIYTRHPESRRGRWIPPS